MEFEINTLSELKEQAKQEKRQIQIDAKNIAKNIIEKTQLLPATVESEIMKALLNNQQVITFNANNVIRQSYVKLTATKRLIENSQFVEPLVNNIAIDMLVTALQEKGYKASRKNGNIIIDLKEAGDQNANWISTITIGLRQSQQ